MGRREKKLHHFRFLKRFINGLQEAVNLLFPKFSEGCCLTVWNEGYLEGNITPVVTEYIAERQRNLFTLARSLKIKAINTQMNCLSMTAAHDSTSLLRWCSNAFSHSVYYFVNQTYSRTTQKFGVYCRKKCTWFFWLDINFLTLVLQKYIDLKIF